MGIAALPTKRFEPGRRQNVPALVVHQWLEAWNAVRFTTKNWRRRPNPYFYIFSLSARDLLSLSAISRRSVEDRVLGEVDLGIQRRHDPQRSRHIGDFVRYGYPWSDLNSSSRLAGE